MSVALVDSAVAHAAPSGAGDPSSTGWLDRMLGLASNTNPWSGVSIGSTKPARALSGPSPDLGIAALDGFAIAGDSATVPMNQTLRALYQNAPAALATPALAATSAVATVAKLPAYTPANGATYPATPLATALKDVARLIKANVGMRAACIDFGDWDMHEGLGTAETGQRMHTHLGEFAAALAAFATDLGADGLKNVTLVTLSEFGRRVAENGSRGVDHGHGNSVFVLGGGVRGGKVYGTWPGLAPAKLVAGDLAATTDYRSVIGEVLQKRCGVGALGEVFPGVTPTTSGLAVART